MKLVKIGFAIIEARTDTAASTGPRGRKAPVLYATHNVAVGVRLRNLRDDTEYRIMPVYFDAEGEEEGE